MNMIKAKLLKDLSYISNCKLKRGEIIIINKMPDNTNWVIDSKAHYAIKIFKHEFETV